MYKSTSRHISVTPLQYLYAYLIPKQSANTKATLKTYYEVPLFKKHLICIITKFYRLFYMSRF